MTGVRSWHFLFFVAIIVAPYLGEAVVRRLKRGSERWQQRSERQQRLLARLPGLIVVIAAAVTLDALDVPW